MRQMNLEPDIQSEVSQKEKNKCCISMHMYGIWKNGTDEPICRAGIEVQTENRFGHSWGRRRQDELRE